MQVHRGSRTVPAGHLSELHVPAAQKVSLSSLPRPMLQFSYLVAAVAVVYLDLLGQAD